MKLRLVGAVLLIATCAVAQVPATTPTLRDAAQDLAAGNLDKADGELQEILQKNPEDYRAMNLLGMIRAQQHRDAEAEQLFQRVIEHQPAMASAHVNLGLLYAQTSRQPDAIAQFEEALRIEPGRKDALHALVNTLRLDARNVAANDPEKALADLLQARKVAPDDPDVLYDFGMVALRMSLYKDAADAFRGALAIRKEDSSALYGLGRAQMGMAQFQDARASFANYLQQRPDDASAHYALGVTLAALQLDADARKEFDASIQLQPVQTESYFQRALLELEQKQSDAAAEDLQRVLARDAHHAGALGGMGRVELERKNYQKAADYLKRSIAAQYQQRQAHYYLGLVYARLGQNDDSAKELQIASDIEHAEAEKQRMGLHILNDPH